jgi:DNA-binding Lrp family transcriptional regulator
MRERRTDGSPDPVSETPNQGTGTPRGAGRVAPMGLEGPVDSFILVQTGPGEAASVFERMRSLEGVIDAQMVTGAYDVIVRVRAADLHSLNVHFLDRLRALDEVLSALASPVMRRPGGAG